MTTDSSLLSLVVGGYSGSWKRDTFHGAGKAHVRRHRPFVFSGNFVSGFPQGHGSFEWLDGVVYDGVVTRNEEGCELSGTATYRWQNGSTYTGSVLNGSRHGSGTYVAQDGITTYEGEWYQGKKHGKGTIYYDEDRNTNYYTGHWNNNKRHGYGEANYPSGSIYKGEWKDGMRHGHGEMQWNDVNEEYIGEWVLGHPHGKGTHRYFSTNSNNNYHAAHAAAAGGGVGGGSLIVGGSSSGGHNNQHQQLEDTTLNVYEGEFRKGLRHGFGTFLYADGSRYEGEWSYNLKEGEGRFFMVNGDVNIGQFKNNRMVDDNAHQAAALNTFVPLYINDLLDLEEDEEDALERVHAYIARKYGLLRRVFTHYIKAGDISKSHANSMTMLQFWKFTKDTRLQTGKLSLASIDRIFLRFKDITQPTVASASPMALSLAQRMGILQLDNRNAAAGSKKDGGGGGGVLVATTNNINNNNNNTTNHNNNNNGGTGGLAAGGGGGAAAAAATATGTTKRLKSVKSNKNKSFSASGNSKKGKASQNQNPDNDKDLQTTTMTSTVDRLEYDSPITEQQATEFARRKWPLHGSRNNNGFTMNNILSVSHEVPPIPVHNNKEKKKKKLYHLYQYNQYNKKSSSALGGSSSSINNTNPAADDHTAAQRKSSSSSSRQRAGSIPLDSSLSSSSSPNHRSGENAAGELVPREKAMTPPPLSQQPLLAPARPPQWKRFWEDFQTTDIHNPAAHVMMFRDFVEAIVRLAYLKYSDYQPTLDLFSRVMLCIENDIVPNTTQAINNNNNNNNKDNSSNPNNNQNGQTTTILLQEAPQVRDAIDHFNQTLRHLFRYYGVHNYNNLDTCPSSSANNNRTQVDQTITVRQFLTMMKEHKVVDKQFGMLNVLALFDHDAIIRHPTTTTTQQNKGGGISSSSILLLDNNNSTVLVDQERTLPTTTTGTGTGGGGGQHDNHHHHQHHGSRAGTPQSITFTTPQHSPHVMSVRDRVNSPLVTSRTNVMKGKRGAEQDLVEKPSTPMRTILPQATSPIPEVLTEGQRNAYKNTVLVSQEIVFTEFVEAMVHCSCLKAAATERANNNNNNNNNNSTFNSTNGSCSMVSNSSFTATGTYSNSPLLQTASPDEVASNLRAFIGQYFKDINAVTFQKPTEDKDREKGENLNTTKQKPDVRLPKPTT